MTQEEKSLLLKDLCSRLPYGVKVLDDMGRTYELQIGNSYLIDLFYGNGDYVEVPIKPYLRSMDDMTEEERHDYNTIAMHTIVTSKGFVHFEATDLIDWLNAHHFDFRNLIERGLAIAVTEENNPY